jgi:hypothetical protein
MLSILGTDFIACWHARKCLKVEYLGRIEYDFQKFRVTGPWDHKDLVSAKKINKKISCLCTFNINEKKILQFSRMALRIPDESTRN